MDSTRKMIHVNVAVSSSMNKFCSCYNGFLTSVFAAVVIITNNPH